MKCWKGFGRERGRTNWYAERYDSEISTGGDEECRVFARSKHLVVTVGRNDEGAIFEVLSDVAGASESAFAARAGEDLSPRIENLTYNLAVLQQVVEKR